MANRDLIAQTGLIYGSRYYDPSISFAGPFQRAQGIVENILANKKAVKAQAEAKVANYLENMAEPLNVAKIAPKYRDAVTKFLVGKRNEYAQAARVASRYNPSSSGYFDAVSKMNSISDSFEQLSSQFDLFKKMKEEDLPDFTGRLVSDGNKSEDLSILTDVLTDKYDISITDGGNISFFTGGISEDGQNYIINKELNDLPKYFNKDFKTANKIVELNKDIYSKGNKLDAASSDFLKLQLKTMMAEGGRETVISLATDDFIIDGGLGLDPALVNDESRHDELTNIVIDQYLKMFQKTAAAGYSVAEQKRKKDLQRYNRTGGTGTSGLKMTAGLKQEVTLQQANADAAKKTAMLIANSAVGGDTNAAVSNYLNFLRARGGNVSGLITADEHYKLYAKNFPKMEEQEILKGYKETYGEGNSMFILKRGQGINPDFDEDYIPYKRFTDMQDANEIYRALLLDIGLSDNAASYFVDYGGSVPSGSDEGVLNVN